MVRRSSVALVALVMIGSLAGCTTLLGADDPSPEATPAPTPAPVPTDEASPGDDIGVDETGVTDSTALAAAHDATLVQPDERLSMWISNQTGQNPTETRTEIWLMETPSETLLQYRTNWTSYSTGDLIGVRVANGTEADVLLTDRAEASSISERQQYHPFEPSSERTVDGETTVVNPAAADQTLVAPVPAEGDASFLHAGPIIEAVFSIPTDMATENADTPPGELRVQGTAQAPPEPVVASWLTNPTDANVEAIITDEGFVRSVELTYRADYDDRPVHVTYRVEYERHD